MKKDIIDHLSRRITEKIEHGQADGSYPFILVIYYNDPFWYPIGEPDSLEIIKKEIIKILSTNRNSTSISGILLFSRDICNGIYIANQDSPYKVSKNVLESLGIKM